MKTTIKVVNSGSDTVSVGIDKGVKLEVGTHEYTLKNELADEVVRVSSVLDYIEVQLITQSPTLTPSTVDGELYIKVKEELETAKASLVTANEDLATANASLTASKAELKTANTSLNASKAELKTAKADLAASKAELKTVKGELTNALSEIEALKKP